MALGVFGAICGLFLPETLHQKLPDSIHEAQQFGADQVRPFLLGKAVLHFLTYYFIQIFIELNLCYRNSGAFQRHQRKMKKKRRMRMKKKNWRDLNKSHEFIYY